jgi:uncharacterized RDD family membrane protein YckC
MAPEGGRDFWDGRHWTVAPRGPHTPPASSAVMFAYAGFWVRFLAYLIDGIVLAVPSLALAVLAQGLGGGSERGLAVRLLAALVSIAYFVVTWARGGTLGMRVLGLGVVNIVTGERIGIGRSALRYVGFVVGALLCYLGWIWVAFDPYKQAWHDRLAGTAVIHR